MVIVRLTENNYWLELRWLGIWDLQLVKTNLYNNIDTKDIVYNAVIVAKPLREFAMFTTWSVPMCWRLHHTATYGA